MQIQRNETDRQNVVISRPVHFFLVKVSSPPFCVFMTELGCFPRDSSAANPGPCIVRHERESGNDPGLQALDCCEPLFTTLMSENVLLEFWNNVNCHRDDNLQ